VVCEAVSGRVPPRCQRRIVAQAGGAVDLLPQDAGVTGVPCGLLDHVRHDPSQRDRVGCAGIGDGGHGGQIGQARTTLLAAGPRLPAGGEELVAGGAGGTVMDRLRSWSWPRKTRWNQCSSTPVSLSRPSQTQSGTRCGMRPLIQAAISTARKTCTRSLASVAASSGIGSTGHPDLSGRCRPRPYRQAAQIGGYRTWGPRPAIVTLRDWRLKARAP
jgi:hypothetical protein